MQLNAGKKDATKHHDGGMKVHHPKADEGFCWANGSEHEAHCEQTPVKGKKWCDQESNHAKCHWGPTPREADDRDGFCWANGIENEAHCQQAPHKGKKWCDKESNHPRCHWGPMPKHDEKRMPCIGNLDEAEDGDRKVIDEDFDHFDINKDGKLDATNKE